MSPSSAPALTRLRALAAGALAAALLAPAARPAAAQAGAAPAPAAATVRGVVRDAAGGRPLAGALVQLAATPNGTPSGAPNAPPNAAAGGPPGAAPPFTASAPSDSLGRFAFAGVPAGRYVLGFFHPLLDSVGVEAPPRAVAVDGRGDVRADLATPSAREIRAAVCGAPAPGDSAAAVLIGVVRDAADGTAVAGATVAGEWQEYTLGRGGVRRATPRFTATTGESGWFALCRVPAGGTVVLQASRGADSTDRVEAQVPADGFLRRELALGRARVVADAGPPPAAPPVEAALRAPGDSASPPPPPRRRLAGDGRVAGVVVAAATGRPLAGALVGLADGPQTRTDANGAWALAEAPTGTRTLVVRALGYYPERRAVDVVAGAGPVRLALNRFSAVLDTARITARAFGTAAGSGFLERRRTGPGRYLTRDQIMRGNPIALGDVFRAAVPGVRLARGDFGVETLVMRGPFGACAPGVYVDGRFFDGLTLLDLDGLVRPSEIVGLEVYTDATAPAQFRRPQGSAFGDPGPCGSVVIWTR